MMGIVIDQLDLGITQPEPAKRLEAAANSRKFGQRGAHGRGGQLKPTADRDGRQHHQQATASHARRHKSAV